MEVQISLWHRSAGGLRKWGAETNTPRPSGLQMRRIVRAPVLGLSIQTGQTQLRENAPLSRLQSGQGRLLACYRPDRHILNGTAQQQTLTASPTNMAPKKRRAAAAGGAETHAAVNPDHLVVLNKRLEEIDAAGARTAAQQHDVRGQHQSRC